MVAPELGSHGLLATIEKRSCTAHREIAKGFSQTVTVGHFALVVFANNKEAYEPDIGGVGMKLWRGHLVVILNFQGLKKIFG